MNPLSSLVEQGTITAVQREQLEETVGAYNHVLFVGGSGTGKTAILQAIADGRSPYLRVVAISGRVDRRQLFSSDVGVNLVMMRCLETVSESQSTSVQGLYHLSLRMKPDLILVDDCNFEQTLLFDDVFAAGTATVATTDSVTTSQRKQLASLGVVVINL